MQELGGLAGAAAAFRRTLEADPSDAQGAAARLAQFGEPEPPAALPEAYVARLLDDYAPRFDRHLTDNLTHRGPALIVEALDAAASARRFASALDFGCGAGLMGEAIRDRGRGVHDALEAADVTAY